MSASTGARTTREARPSHSTTTGFGGFAGSFFASPFFASATASSPLSPLFSPSFRSASFFASFASPGVTSSLSGAKGSATSFRRARAKIPVRRFPA